MNIDDVKHLCRSLPGTHEKQNGPPSNILVYKVGSRKFAYFKTSEPEQWRFSVRATPERFLELTDQDGMKPARYMHRFHWVTIVDVESVPEGYLKELIQWSYDKALSGLPKAEQRKLAVAQA
ncbi:MAG: MmcQ/YjbR family DNA-binding protein [Marinobacter sp.]|uniref:MmcQ/YjbR family DNA-binding protein n=1 Tax=Marinobacter sp. TaxID=50741 RepID=UPI00299E9134|nr:MmcQ/YjbR family DNA-binding protein [Marinobacter sp.]MDX1757923.1 MmcQ/YjbR family DNA-binding protein [Marinobacter sp.]